MYDWDDEDDDDDYYGEDDDSDGEQDMPIIQVQKKQEIAEVSKLSLCFCFKEIFLISFLVRYARTCVQNILKCKKNEWF